MPSFQAVAAGFSYIRTHGFDLNGVWSLSLKVVFILVRITEESIIQTVLFSNCAYLSAYIFHWVNCIAM